MRGEGKRDQRGIPFDHPSGMTGKKGWRRLTPDLRGAEALAKDLIAAEAILLKKNGKKRRKGVSHCEILRGRRKRKGETGSSRKSTFGGLRTLIRSSRPGSIPSAAFPASFQPNLGSTFHPDIVVQRYVVC